MAIATPTFKIAHTDNYSNLPPAAQFELLKVRLQYFATLQKVKAYFIEVRKKKHLCLCLQGLVSFAFSVSLWTCGKCSIPFSHVKYHPS